MKEKTVDVVEGMKALNFYKLFCVLGFRPHLLVSHFLTSFFLPFCLFGLSPCPCVSLLYFFLLLLVFIILVLFFCVCCDF